MSKYTIKNLANALLKLDVSECAMCGADAEIYFATHKQTGLHEIKIFCPDCGSGFDFIDVIKSLEGEDEVKKLEIGVADCIKAEKEADRKCLGYSRINDDEPVQQCKDCTSYTGWESAAE